MRLLLSIFIFTISLHTKELQSCYTIQLMSVPNTTQHKTLLSKSTHPQECLIMDIADTTTIRCGCYETYQTAKEQLPRYKEKYKNSYIATSYKFRFTSQTKQHKKSINNNDEEELRLILQTFLYTNDLENAYKTALIGYKKNPNSYYWNQKMAEITKWTGKRQETMKYLKFMYLQTHDPKLEQEIVNYGLTDYQFEAIADLVLYQAKTNPSKENIQRMIYVYSQLGEPQKAAHTLHTLYKKNPNKIEYLTQELQIYMDMGDLTKASNIIEEIQKKKLFNTKNVKLLTYYYYLKKNIEKSYSLLQTIDYHKHYDKELFAMQSDLGWYLQKYLQAAQASKTLIIKGDGRLVDYERVIYAYQAKDRKFAMRTALEAYKKFHLSYLFYIFAQHAIKYKDYSMLMQTTKAIEAEKNPIIHEANYWLIKAQVYLHVNNIEASEYALQKALALSHNSTQIALSAIDIYLKLNLYKKATYVMQNITKQQDLSPAFYFIIASIYNTLHDENHASFYVEQLVRQNNPITFTKNFKFLQAELYRTQFRQAEALTKIKEILLLLDKEAKENPKILITDEYLYDYLRAQLYLMRADAFEKKLSQAKKYLSKTHYDDINYAWAVKIGANEKAHKIYMATQNKAMWLKLSNALAQQDHTEIENLLLLHLASMPKDDATYAAQNDGQISLAQSLTFNSLDTNKYNQTAYINMRNITKRRSDLLTTKTSYYNRNPLLRKYIKTKNTLYIDNGTYFLTNFDYYTNVSINEDILINPPSRSLYLSIGLKKEFNKGNILFLSGHAKSMRSYYFFKTEGEYILNRYVTLYASAAKNIKSDESIELLLGGKKDILSFGFLYTLRNSTTLDVTYSKSSYTSEDNINLGNGNYLNASLSYQIRNGYPDMRIGVFSNFATYHENSGSKGVIDNLQNNPFNVLPNNFYNIGANFSYGMQNSRIYTRVWRPYFELSSYYDSELGAFSYGFNGGYGGKIFTQDHMVVGVNYSSDVNGIGGSIYELFLRYEFLYTH